MDWFQHLEPPISGCDNFIQICPPCERFRFGKIVVCDETGEGGFEFVGGSEDAVFQSSSGKLGKDAFDGVQP